MKYAIVILGGAADEPQPELDGRTPLQAAEAPTLAHLAEVGRLGQVHLAADGIPPGPDAALLALLGYKPSKHYPGHAPLHALGVELPLDERDWCFELSLLSVVEGITQPTGALNIPEGEAQALIRGRLPQLDLPGAVVHPGQSTRPGTPAHLLIDPAGEGPDADPHGWSEVVTHRPIDIALAPLRKHYPVGGAGGERLKRLITSSAAQLADHELNQARAEMGEPPITHLWLWGQGTCVKGAGRRVPWTERFGLTGVVISPDPAMRGVARLVGLDALSPEAPSAIDVAEAIERYDLVIVHSDAPQQVAMEAGPREKARAIGQADAQLLKPIHSALCATGDRYRILTTPLHVTHLATRRESADPVPFLIAGEKITNVVPRPLAEPDAAHADLQVPFGHELMEFFLRGGIR